MVPVNVRNVMVRINAADATVMGMYGLAVEWRNIPNVPIAMEQVSAKLVMYLAAHLVTAVLQPA